MDLAGMRLAGLVVVGDDENVPATKILVEVGMPVAGAARVRCGDEGAEIHDVLDILFALYDQDRRVRVFQQLGQLVRNALLGDAALYEPLAVPVLLPKSLGRRAIDPQSRRAI